MTKKVFFLVFVVFNTSLCSQQELRTIFGDVYYEPDRYKTQYDATDSTPYLNVDFTPAKINDINETKMVRFNAFDESVEVMVNAKKVVILQDSQAYTIKLLDGSKKVYETKKYGDEEDKVKTSFFELIARNTKYALFLKEKKKYVKAKKAQGYEASKPAMFKKRKDTYYITDFKEQSELVIKIPSKVKTFVSFFPSHAKQVKMFIKKYKLKIDEGEDLIKIFDFYFDSI
ncbi:MAG: hypothetical protein KJO63_15860 [Maribacter sp.]|nr:hypothetical protein [Maribacter sp.]